MQGMVLSFSLLSVLMVWVSHSATIFWGVKYPFSYRRIQKTKYFKLIHIAVLVISLTLPWIPGVIVISIDSYAIPTFPPYHSCFPLDSVNVLFTFIMPACVVLCVGDTLVILIMWNLCKNKRQVSYLYYLK